MKRSKHTPLMRLTTFFTAIALMFTLFGIMPEGVLKAAADSDGDFTYIVSNGEATVTGYTGDGGNITIPSTLGGAPVTTIGDNAFAHNHDIQTVIFPKSLVSIGDSAFYNSTIKRLELYFSKDFKTIGKSAFDHCHSLEYISFPSGLETIGEDAFRMCEALKSVSLPDKVTKVGVGAFSKTGLESIRISESMTKLPCHFASYCEQLKTVIIPDNITEIEYYAFYASSIEYIYIPSSVTAFSDKYGDIFTMDSCMTIIGSTGSAAETYAAENGIDFVDVDALLSDVAYTIKPKQSSKIIKPESLAAGTSLKGVADGTEIRMGAGGIDEGKVINSMSLWFGVNVTSYSGTTKLSTSTPTGVTVTVEGDSFTAKLPDTLDRKAVLEKIIENAGKGYTSVLTADVEVTPTYGDNYVPSGIGTYTFYLDKEDTSYYIFGEQNYAEAFKATLYALVKSGRITKNGNNYDIDKDGSTDIYLSGNTLFRADTRSIGDFSDTLTLTKQEEEYAREYYSAMTPAEQKAAHASYMNSITFVFPKLEKNVELTNKGSYTLDLSSGSAAITDDAAKVEIFETLKALADTGAIIYNNTNGTYDIDNDSNYDINVSGTNYTVLDTASIEGVRTISLTAEQIAAVKDNINKRWSTLIEMYGFGYYNTISFIFPTKPHTHTEGQAKKENIVPATCTTAGSYDEVVRCTKCGEVISKTHVVVKAAGHTPAAAVKENVKDSTCTKEGSYDEVVYCSVCHEEISRVTKTIAKKAHTLTKIARVEPTTEKEGNIEYYKCSVCGKLFADAAGTKEITAASTVIPKLDKHIPGDANDDDLVTVDDALLIQQAIAGWNVKINLKNADCDGYEGLSVDDVLLIQQSIAGWSVTLK